MNSDNFQLSRADLIDQYKIVRNWTEVIAKPLETEDYVIQSMPDVSPTKWHMAHVSWFFETFILTDNFKNYKPLDENYNYLFNSYYVQVGEQFKRQHRGLLSRPSVKEIYEYRKFIDYHMIELLETIEDEILNRIAVTINIGLNHEQQHQELILTDIKNVFSFNPMKTAYNEKADNDEIEIPDINWIEFDEGIFEAGYKGNHFFFDNEKPVHKTFINKFKFADRLVTNGEYIEFIESRGYSNIPLWLSQGAARVQSENWKAPLYWEKVDNEWFYFTLNGFKKVNLSEPVCHVSKYEADAYANWKGCRLPTEHEWELAAQSQSILGNFAEEENFHPVPLNLENDTNEIKQMFGDVWEWTMSDYAPYPGYKVPEGAIGEYNGKFMSEQIVLRGGSCATAQNHIRKSYRNFFYPKDRWQFMGIRLAKDVG